MNLPKATDASPAGTHRPVLVVDDNLVNATLIGHLVARHGRMVELADSGREALRRIAKGGVAGAIIDLRMPDMDGFDTARAIRAGEGCGSGRMPIIAVTADMQPGLRECALAAGMDELLLKPISVAAVATIVARFFPADQLPGSSERIAPAPAASSIDLTILAHSERQEPGRAARMLGECFAGLAAVDGELPALIAGNSYLGAQRLVHRLHADAIAIGAIDLSDVLYELEAALRSGDPVRCQRALRTVHAARDRLCSALAEHDLAWLPSGLSRQAGRGNAAPR